MLGLEKAAALAVVDGHRRLGRWDAHRLLLLETIERLVVQLPDASQRVLEFRLVVDGSQRPGDLTRGGLRREAHLAGRRVVDQEIGEPENPEGDQGLFGCPDRGRQPEHSDRDDAGRLQGLENAPGMIQQVTYTDRARGQPPLTRNAPQACCPDDHHVQERLMPSTSGQDT